MGRKKEPEANYEALLLKRKYDPNKEPPPEQIAFLIESKNIGTLQNFVTITGMQKSGKTTFMSAMIAAALTNTEQLGMRFRLPHERRRVCYWDTEQGDNDFYRTMERIKSFIGTDTLPPHFDSYNFREDEPEAVIFMLEKYLELHPDCSLLVIDGILDMIESYNDEAHSKRLVNLLKRITKVNNLLALCTLHKGKTTNNTLGHLGAMADRAAQSVLFVEKNKERNTLILKSDYLRSADDFTPIEIYHNNTTHRWEQTIYNPDQEAKVSGKERMAQPQDIADDTHRMNVIRIFSFQDMITYKKLTHDIVELYAVGMNWAKKCVRHLLDKNFIYKTSDGYTNKPQAKLFIK